MATENPEVAFYLEFARLMSNYENAKENRETDRETYEAAARELATWRRDIRILSGRVGVETAVAAAQAQEV